jgi:hypothetical protein
LFSANFLYCGYFYREVLFILCNKPGPGGDPAPHQFDRGQAASNVPEILAITARGTHRNIDPEQTTYRRLSSPNLILNPLNVAEVGVAPGICA